MEALTGAAIRDSFVNCCKGEAGRIRLRAGFADGGVPWADLDFLGWTDPAAPLRAALVVPGEAGPTGIVLRLPDVRKAHWLVPAEHVPGLPDRPRGAGVALFVAPLRGRRAAPATPSASTSAPTWPARSTCAANGSRRCGWSGARRR